MRYDSIIKPATTVDHSTLHSILEGTIKEIFDPINLFNNIHVYTKAVFNLRNIFFEPFIKQTLKSNPAILKAIAAKQNLDINYKQSVYVILNLNNTSKIVQWINNIGADTIPNQEYIKNISLYKSITLLNEATHNGQNSFIRNQFVEVYYQCYALYERIFPEDSPEVKFSDAVSVEKYMSNSLNDMIKAKENEYNSILATLKNLESQNVERAVEIRNYTERLERKEEAIIKLQEENTRLNNSIHLYRQKINEYLNAKNRNEQDTFRLIDTLIKYSPSDIKMDSLKYSEDLKRVALEIENILKFNNSKDEY